MGSVNFTSYNIYQVGTDYITVAFSYTANSPYGGYIQFANFENNDNNNLGGSEPSISLPRSSSNSGSSTLTITGLNPGWTYEPTLTGNFYGPSGGVIVGQSIVFNVTTNPQPPPPPPPAPPAPGTLTGLGYIDGTTSVALSWNSLPVISGTTNYYNVYRTIQGGTETYLGNTTNNSYTDSAPGSERPITYRVLPYAVGNGYSYSGTTYGTGASVTVPVPFKWSVWDGTTEILGLKPSVWDGSKEITGIETQVSS